MVKLNPGYTLIEVIVTLAIISLIVSISSLNFTNVYKNLSADAKLMQSAEKVNFVFSRSRVNGFVNRDIYAVRYQQDNVNKKGTFKAFLDNNMDGVSDDGNSIIAEIDLSQIKVDILCNGNHLNSITDMYSVDGMFGKYIGKASGTNDPIIDPVYGNMKITLSIDKYQKIINISNSLPDIQE